MEMKDEKILRQLYLFNNVNTYINKEKDYGIERFYNKLALLSPRIEVIRKLYWKNAARLKV